MWLLKDKAGNITYLTPTGTFSIGRKKGSLVLSDDSVSRNHAVISIENKYHINQIKSNSQPLSECKIQDSGSRYGSFILRANEPELRVTKEGELLRHKDQIRFGVQQSIFTVLYVPVITATSGLSKNEKNELQTITDKIDGRITMGWEPLCTHMTLSEPKISEKLTCALAFGTPNVPMDYWRMVLKAFESNEQMPEPDGFAQHLNDKFTLFGEISLAPDSRRRNLFKDLTFVHFDSGQYSVHKRMIELAGGKSLLYKQNTQGNLDVCDENVVVVQLVESNTTQATGTGDGNYMKACEQLGKCRRRAIPASEIALAIIHCSREKCCNPKYDYVGIFRKKKNCPTEKSSVLALETQDVEAPGPSRVPASLAREAGKFPGHNNPHFLKESTEYESESQIDANKLNKNSLDAGESFSRQSRLENRAQTLHNPLNSQFDNASIQVVSPNYESCLSNDSKIEDPPKKRARDEEDGSFDVKKKKRVSPPSLEYGDAEEPVKALSPKEVISDCDDVLFSDEEPLEQQLEKCAKKAEERIEENPPQVSEKRESLKKNPFASQRKSSDDLAELSPKKRKAEDPVSVYSPNAKKTSSSLNKTTPVKKTKLPSTAERGQPTLTKFLSPKKETSEEPPGTSPKKAQRHKQDFAEASTSKDYSKFETKSISRDSKMLLNLHTSMQSCLRIEICDETVLSEPKFKKKFNKVYQTQPPRVKFVPWEQMNTSREGNKEKSMMYDETESPRKKPSKSHKKMLRL